MSKIQKYRNHFELYLRGKPVFNYTIYCENYIKEI